MTLKQSRDTVKQALKTSIAVLSCRSENACMHWWCGLFTLLCPTVGIQVQISGFSTAFILAVRVEGRRRAGLAVKQCRLCCP